MIVLGLGRAADLHSTYAASPRLLLESNQWMRKVGWRNTLLINVAFVLAVPLVFGRSGTVMIAAFSSLLAYRNYTLVPLCRAIGEEGYLKAITQYHRSSSARAYSCVVLVKLAIFVSLGIAIIGIVAVDHSSRMWFVADVGRAFVFYGFFIATFEMFARLQSRAASPGH
ncbi:MAG: hypothetical protein H7Y89_00100 [Steroidobacteraceae bacterium]|nr:hypothetical protein [Steroidobacteraceae bacterium]